MLGAIRSIGWRRPQPPWPPGFRLPGPRCTVWVASGIQTRGDCPKCDLHGGGEGCIAEHGSLRHTISFANPAIETDRSNLSGIVGRPASPGPLEVGANRARCLLPPRNRAATRGFADFVPARPVARVRRSLQDGRRRFAGKDRRPVQLHLLIPKIADSRDGNHCSRCSIGRQNFRAARSWPRQAQRTGKLSRPVRFDGVSAWPARGDRRRSWPAKIVYASCRPAGARASAISCRPSSSRG